MADKTVTKSTVVASANARTNSAQSAEAIGLMSPVAFDATSPKKLVEGDANDATRSQIVGLALNEVSGADQPVTYLISDPNFVPGISMTLGEILVLSATQGGIAPDTDLASGMYPVVLMVPLTTSTAAVNISAMSRGGLIP